MESQAIAALSLGVILGMRHAFDPDHLVAVATLLSKSGKPLHALWIGVSWGLGHTTTLFLAALVIIVLGFTISDQLAMALEFAVGILLVLLGMQVVWRLRLWRWHIHVHDHPEEKHLHLHSHSADDLHLESHHRLASTTPGFRGKSFVVGLVHGLAGSAALMLLVLTSLDSPLLGLAYVALFGLGSVVAMGAVTVLVGLPLTLSSRGGPAISRAIQGTAGVGAILFGGFLMYQIGIMEGLLV